jgi:hypothetical protein
MTDPQPIRLVEPPIIAIPNEDVTVWRDPRDGSIVLLVGGEGNVPGDSILIPAHQLTATWMTLRELDDA